MTPAPAIAQDTLALGLALLGAFVVLMVSGYIVMRVWAHYGWSRRDVDGAAGPRAFTGGLANQYDIDHGERMVRRALADAQSDDDLEQVRELIRQRGIDPAFLSEESRRRLGIDWDDVVMGKPSEREPRPKQR